MSRDHRYYCGYIIGSLSGTLCIGFSGNLHERVFQHKFHHFEGFTAKYEVTRLLYWESSFRPGRYFADLGSSLGLPPLDPWMRVEGRDASTAQ